MSAEVLDPPAAARRPSAEAAPPARPAGALQRALPWLVAVASLAVAYAATYRLKSGDSAIYFTYFQNFFDRPFSFHPGDVTSGATSPLHVVLNAPLHALFGESFVEPATVLAYALLFGGVVLLALSFDRRGPALILFSLLVLVNVPLTSSTSSLYETGLVFLGVAALWYSVARDRDLLGTAVAGLLPLARPELALVTAGALAYFLWRADDRRRYLGAAALALVPLAAFFAYMAISTGNLIPSSASARLSTAQEEELSYPTAVWRSLKALVTDHGTLVYPLGGLAFLAVLALRRLRSMWRETALLALLILPFVVFPPLAYAPRYLIAASVVLSIVLVRALLSMRARAVLPIAAVALVLLSAWAYSSGIAERRFDYDTVLLKDLAGRLNPVTSSSDRVLNYEVQSQYHLDAEVISMDAIVGGQTKDALDDPTAWPRLIRAEGIDYVVTMGALSYRRMFRGSILADLYAHDLRSPVGSSVTLGGITFEKAMTNPYFASPRLYEERTWPEPLNSGTTLRVYRDKRGWEGHQIMWNSVYRVVRVTAAAAAPAAPAG
jgi:hypothetical protein